MQPDFEDEDHLYTRIARLKFAFAREVAGYDVSEGEGQEPINAVYYKNDGASFLCEGLDLIDTLDEIFATEPSSDECVSQCTSWTDNRLDDEIESPVGLNCSDGNEGWMSTSYTNAENARIGGRSVVNGCCVVNAYAGAAGDRGFDTSNLNKTWGAYDDGESEDNNILIFVR